MHPAGGYRGDANDVPFFLAPPAVNPGDACLVVFADRDLDAWMEGREDKGWVIDSGAPEAFSF